MLKTITKPVDLKKKDDIISCVNTSLSSKIVSGNSKELSPLAVESVFKIIDPNTATNVDLRDIRIVKKVGGTIEDTEMVHGLVFTQNKPSQSSGGPTRIENPKIALI